MRVSPCFTRRNDIVRRSSRRSDKDNTRLKYDIIRSDTVWNMWTPGLAGQTSSKRIMPTRAESMTHISPQKKEGLENLVCFIDWFKYF
jgi:hypothetical protein